MLDAGNGACVIEATSMASAQGRLDGTRFAALVFTNLTQDHLDFHGTMDEYFEAKRRLFAQAERAGDQPRLTSTVPGSSAEHPGADARLSRGERARALDGDRAQAAADASIGERPRGCRCGARARDRRGRDRAGLESRARRPGPLRPRRRGAAVHGARRLRAHARRARERARRGARACPQARIICVFGCGGDRDRASGR